eukprot:219607-Ditylum_brightwellii.AAC.1
MVNKVSQVLKHYTQKYAGRSSNIGCNYPRTVFLRTIKTRPNLAPNLLMTHFGQRSAATALADAGILITNLKQAGRWKSDLVVEGYLENSTAKKNEQMSMLGAEPTKKLKN